MKRHCMVVHAYYPLGETRVQRQAVALRRCGYEVDVICLRQPGEAARSVDEDGVSVYRLPVQRRRGGYARQLLEYLAFFVLVFLQLAWLQRSRRYGVVQVHNLPDFLVFAALVPRLMGARLILDLHDLMPEFFAARALGDSEVRSGKEMDGLTVRLVAWQEQISCRFAHHVITVTDVWKETLVRRGVPAQKITVVMNVADTALFQRVRFQRRERAGDSFSLVYHGTFTHRYGVDLALVAVDEARKRIPGIHLSLLGDGEYRGNLERLVATLGLEQHVTLSERMLPAAELAPLLAQADVGLVPNRSNVFTDGLLPTKLLEYVAMDIPVLAARTPTIAAYFDETMVRFFEPSDALDLARQIVALHRDRAALAGLAHHAARFHRQINWEKMAETYVALVERLNDRRPALRPSW